jgi:hypothetical protein
MVKNTSLEAERGRRIAEQGICPICMISWRLDSHIEM